MASLQALLVSVYLFAIAFNQNLVDANFHKSMFVVWSPDHAVISSNGDDLQLKMDQQSGSAIQSKRPFLYGSIEMLIKLIPGNSAGTVTAYYVTSTGRKHDEIDFEFLGNVSGQPYTVSTNVYADGIGNREQQFYLWFDPTADYHNYTIHWNPSEIVWYIDQIPIRVYRNYRKEGIGFPSQAMRVYCSLWNGEQWATRKGLDKIDWSKAPFIANFRHFRARACKWHGPASISQCTAKAPANWWMSPGYSQLSNGQMAQMKSIRDKYLIYDYCKDWNRFVKHVPRECFKQQF